MLKEKSSSGPARLTVLMDGIVADYGIVAEKFCNGNGAKTIAYSVKIILTT